jgi:hypothetical protein
MATIGSINVILSAQSAAFSAGMRKARGEIKAFKAESAGLRTAMTGLRTALAGVGLAAVTHYVRGVVEAADKQSDMAAQYGKTQHRPRADE